MHFRSALLSFWTGVLLWQLTRVFGGEADWHSLALPAVAVGVCVGLFARSTTGYLLLLVFGLTILFPLAVIATFALGVWLAGSPMPALPALGALMTHSVRSFALGLALLLAVHGLTLYEIIEAPGDDILR